MIDFFHVSGSQTDLVSVRTVAVRRLADQLLLRQLPFQGFFRFGPGIRGSRDTHSLVDIGPPGKRIADRAAKARGCAAERLDFRGMVVRLILEIDQPLLGFPVDFYRYYDTAGIDLV
jgi:hypothetical protein